MAVRRLAAMRVTGLRRREGRVHYPMRCVTSPTFRFCRAAGPIALIALSGCAGGVATIGPPRMPKVAPGAPVPAEPKVTASEVLATASARVAQDDFAGAADALGALPAAERVGVARELAESAAARDPWRAGRLAVAMPEGDPQAAAAEVVVRAMLARDPDATVRWALAATDPAAGFAVRRAVAEQFVQGDATAALERFTAVPISPERDSLLALAAAAWVRHDRTTALAWGRALPAGETRALAISSMGFEIAQTAPERAVEVAETLPEGHDRWQLFSAIGQTWVARDPEAAWSWARGFPEGEARTAAVAGIETGLGGAGLRNPALAAGLAGGGARRVAVGGTVAGAGGAGAPAPGLAREDALRRQFEEMLRRSPRLAADWLTSLPSPDRSDEMLARLTREWFATDPGAARKWLQLNVPSRAQREFLLQGVRP